MKLTSSPFDSSHYGIEVGKLELTDSALLGAAIDDARTRGFDVVFLRIPESDTAMVDALSALGLRPMETLVTFERPLDESYEPIARPRSDFVIEKHAKLEAERDIAAIERLTRESIRNTHLHADPRLPAEATRNLYGAWVRNDVTGRAAVTFVARVDGEIHGYFTILRGERTAIMDLASVTDTMRGSGMGGALIEAFFVWAAENGLPAQVGTQSDNPAQRLYERLGYVPKHRQLAYHLWLDAL